MRTELKPFDRTGALARSFNLTASLERTGKASARAEFQLRGAMEELVIATPALSDRRDELWKSSVFEVYVRPVGQQSYGEFNLATSGEWAGYGFDGYRSGMTDLEGQEPVIEVVRRLDGYDLSANLDLSGLEGAAENAWDVGLNAVLEEKSGALSYWALQHAARKPDFHDAACFALRVPAAGQS